MTDNPESVEPSRWQDANGKIDIKEMMIDLKVGAMIGPLITQRRPGRREMGANLIALADVADESISECLDVEFDGDQEPHVDQWLLPKDSPGSVQDRELRSSPWAKVATVTRSSDRDPGRILIMARYLAHAVIDNLRSVGILLQDPRSIRAPFAMARVTIDAQAQLFHVVEPQLLAQDRLKRCLNLQLAALALDVKADVKAGDLEQADQDFAKAVELMDAAQSSGAKLSKENSKVERQVRLIQPQADPADIRTALHSAFEDGESWHFLSTVVHTQDDSGFRLMTGLDGFDNPHADSIMAIRLFGVLVGFERCIEALSAYTTWDLQSVNDTIAQILPIWHAAGGGRDDKIRLGVEAEFSEEIAHAEAYWRGIFDQIDVRDQD